MYESTFVNMPSFWYGLKRPADSGRANTRPPEKAASTRTAFEQGEQRESERHDGGIDSPRGR